MQFSSSIRQLEVALDAVEAELADVDVERFTQAMRRCNSLYAKALSFSDDVTAAKTSGSSVREVRATRALQHKFGKVPGLGNAVSEGGLSLRQAEVVANNPEVAEQLIEVAPGKTVEELRREAARLQQTSTEDEAERYRRLRRRRDFRYWTTDEGLTRFLVDLPPLEAGELLAEHRAVENALVREPGATAGQHRADAFVAMFKTKGSFVKTKRVVNIHVDQESLSRGWVEGEGFCEVAGGSNIPVAIARNCFEEATLRVLVKAKNQLVWSGELDKDLPERVKEAIRAANRHKCERCGGPNPQVDHRQALDNGGTHDPSNLDALCPACHGDKTIDDVPYSEKYYTNPRPREPAG